MATNPRVRITKVGLEKLQNAKKNKKLTYEKISEQILGDNDKGKVTTVKRIFTESDMRGFYEENVVAVGKILGLELKRNIDYIIINSSIWDQLKEKATTRKDEMGVIIYTGKQQGLIPPSLYKRFVLMVDPVQFQMSLKDSSENLHLLLLQKGDNDAEISCLCPSWFAEEPQLKKGKITLPNKEIFYFENKAPGKVQILAITSPQPFDPDQLTWLSSANDDLIILNDDHLNELLKYVENSEDFSFYLTEFEVIR